MAQSGATTGALVRPTNRGAAKWLEICGTTAAARRPLLMLAPIAVTYEYAMTQGEGRNTWRTDNRYSPCPGTQNLVSRARSGDAACRRIIHEAASMIGIAVGTLANLCAPELVVLGGSLSAAGDLLTQPLRTALDQTAFAATTSRMSVKIARLSRWASACGATALVFDQITV